MPHLQAFVQQKTGVQNWGQSHLGFVVSYMRVQVRQTKSSKHLGSEKLPFFMKRYADTHWRRKARGGPGDTGKYSVVVGDCQVRWMHMMEDR